MGISFPSVRVPSPGSILNDAKEKAGDLADTGKRTVDRGRDYTSDKINSGRDFVSGKADSGRDFVTDKVDSGRDFVTGKVDSGRDFVTDKVDSGRDFVTDKVDGGRDFVTDKVDSGRDFVTDKVDSGRDFVTDKVDSGRDYASDKFESGQEIVSDKINDGANAIQQAIEKVADIAKSTEDYTTITSDDVHNLQPGDSVSIDAKAGGGEGVIVGAEQGLTISLGDDGVYTVSQDGSGKVGGGIKDFGEVGGQLGGEREFKFDNPEDAAKAVGILQKQAFAASSALANPIAIPFVAGYVLSGEAERDQKWLDQHTSKLEVGPGIYGKLGVPKTGLEIDGLAEEFEKEGNGTGALVGVEVQASADRNYAVEYEDGVSKTIVESVDITVSGDIDLETIKNQRGFNPTPGVQDSSDDELAPLESLGVEADGEANVRIEKRTDVDSREVEYRIIVSNEGSLQDERSFNQEYSGTVQEDQIDDIIRDIGDGNVIDVIDVIKAINPEYEYYESDIDRIGFDFGFVVGELGAGKEYRDIDEDSRSSFG